MNLRQRRQDLHYTIKSPYWLHIKMWFYTQSMIIVDIIKRGWSIGALQKFTPMADWTIAEINAAERDLFSHISMLSERHIAHRTDSQHKKKKKKKKNTTI